MRPLALIVLAGIACAGCGGGRRSSTAPAPARPAVRGASTVQARFGGIPQHGRALGSPKAPYTLVWFADLQCPFCARFDRLVLPSVLAKMVRRGRLRMELRMIAFIGPQSAPAAAVAVAAGMQNRLWQFADLWYRNQGPENSGYATPHFTGSIAKAVPGLSLGRLNAASGTPSLRRQLEDNARVAKTAGVTRTPTLLLGRTGHVPQPFEHGPYDPGAFLARLRSAIAQL